MSKTDGAWRDSDRPEIDDGGVRIRGQHVMRDDAPGDELSYPLPGLWIGNTDGITEHLLKIQEFGDADHYPKSVLVEREEIPKIIEVLIARAYPRDIDDIRERVELALKDFEADREV